jgi:cation diffusion facilitator family transporter
VNRTLKIGVGSLAISLIVLAVKYAAFVVTGSVALYSDALESVVNVATAGAVIVALKVAGKPPDAEHPYGHHKAEYLSAVVVGGLIVAAAIAILHEAYLGFIAPKPIEAPWTGLAVSTTATLINAGWSAFLIRQGRLHRSASLVADGKHLFADVVTSVGVLVGVGLVVATGVTVLDAVIAALVAVHVLRSGWEVIKENASGLMDEAAPAEELARIRETIAAASGEAIEAHDLRTRHAGKATFIDFHLVVPSAMEVGDAHTICDRIEAALRNEIPGATTTIHVEPEGKAKNEGAFLV